MQRLLPTVLLVGLAIAITAAMIMSGSSKPPKDPAPEANQQAAKPAPAATPKPVDPPAATPKAALEPTATPDPPANPTPSGAPRTPKKAVGSLGDLKAVGAKSRPVDQQIGGWRGDSKYHLLAQFTPYGGGIRHLLLSQYTQRVGVRTEDHPGDAEAIEALVTHGFSPARIHEHIKELDSKGDARSKDETAIYEKLKAAEATAETLNTELAVPYALMREHRKWLSSAQWKDRRRWGNVGSAFDQYRYPMSAYVIDINGSKVPLWTQRWDVKQHQGDDGTQHVIFTLSIVDSDSKPVLHLKRDWSLPPKSYDLRLSQSFQNATDQPLEVRLSQYGPADVTKEGGYIGDRRKVFIGHVPASGATREVAVGEYTRQDVVENDDPEDEDLGLLWPREEWDSRSLAWFGLDSRYFAVIMHGQHDAESRGPPAVDASVSQLRRFVWSDKGNDDKQRMALVMDLVPMQIAAGETGSVDLHLYAGPKSRQELKEEPIFVAEGMGNVIVYNLGGFCAFCTFAWLAEFMIGFLVFIHSLVGDWGMAIILLVALVRTLLHPLTAWSQTNMMKVSKQMQKLAPELTKLKERYKDDQTKLNREMMDLYREKGVNPGAFALGCLPMFLQMPIWFALYAVLYFAIELRQAPAFWGFFQNISGGSWAFLADLSQQDRFIPLPSSIHVTIPVVNQTLESFNILPILMGIVFYFQQKLTPQPEAMSEQQAQQQKIMKTMMIFMFPILLFFAPSGLTLYILTSTAVGILESTRVRKNIKALEDSGELYAPKKKREPKKGGFMQKMMEKLEEQQRVAEQRQGGDQPTKPPQGPKRKGKGGQGKGKKGRKR
jgi:YidC/Oxa1 family membrane protein insertase